VRCEHRGLFPAPEPGLGKESWLQHGRTHDEAFFDFIHPEDLVKTQKVVATLTSQEKVLSFENRYRCKDGTYRYLDGPRSRPET